MIKTLFTVLYFCMQEKSARLNQQTSNLENVRKQLESKTQWKQKEQIKPNIASNKIELINRSHPSKQKIHPVPASSIKFINHRKRDHGQMKKELL